MVIPFLLKSPNMANSMLACGEAALDKHDAAEKIFSKSLTHYPQGFLLWYHRVLCALKRNDRGAARKLLSECVLQFVDKSSVEQPTTGVSVGGPCTKNNQIRILLLSRARPTRAC